MIEKQTIYSKQLNRDVDIYIRLPQNYNKNISYNVLYMHDGQNLFFKSDSSFNMIWDVDKTLCDLENQGFENLIVVGVSSNKSNNGYLRLAEYSYYDSSEVYNWMIDARNYQDMEILENKILLSRAKFYEDFLVKTLFSYIDKTYNTKNRYMMGSSMGGMFTLCFALKNPHLLTKAFCLSNAFHYNLSAVFSDCCYTPTKIYLDVGDSESSQGKINSFKYINCNKIIYNELLRYENYVHFKIIKDAKHNEIAWSKRFANVLKSL